MDIGFAAAAVAVVVVIVAFIQICTLHAAIKANFTRQLGLVGPSVGWSVGQLVRRLVG